MMEAFVAQMTATDAEQVRLQAEAYNQALTGTRTASTDLGKDDFLKILITQLTHQDPTEPMEDREFIAQLAQFSSLEQMTNLSSQFEQMSAMLQSGQAMNLLGKTVDIVLGESTISGEVEEVTGGEYPQVLVNGFYYDYNNVQAVRTEEE